jgi:hypothetical protein
MPLPHHARKMAFALCSASTLLASETRAAGPAGTDAVSSVTSGDTTASRRRAADLYDRAVALYERARYAEAARAFFEADELVPSSDALSSAIAAARLAHDYLLVARAAGRATERESSDPKLASDARAALAEAEAHLVRVDLSCRPGPCQPSIEGVAVSAGRHLLLPGTRSFSASFPNEQVTSEQRASLAAGSLYTITLTPPVPDPKPAVAAREVIVPAARDTPSAPKKPLPPWVFYAGAGSSLVLAGISVWSGVDALNDVDHYESTRTGADRDTARSSVRRTDVLLAGTVLMTGVTIYGGLRWVDFGASGSALTVTPRAAGALLTWSGKL